jgi:hypothetical protein
MRGYVKAAEDRAERVAAEEELRLAKARKEALDELTEPVPARPDIRPAVRQSEVQLRAAADYRMLGLRPDAALEQVEAAWRELARRADPKRFPEGSDEEKRAADILKRINGAYARIREYVNPTEGRFGRLEL